ncbi:MAG: PAS domain S-box protein [Nitrospinota bacterium]|nr:PAS domain S-box protein [Nitrospinota bacterium]
MVTSQDSILKNIFDAFPDAIFLGDRETGLLIDVNPAGERLVGRSRDEIIGMHQSRLHPPQMDESSRKLFAEHARKLASGGLAEFQVIHASGAIIPVEITGMIITFEGRDVLMGVFRDISTRKDALEKLKRNQETLDQAQRVAHLGIWSWDIKDNALYWSDENCRIFGLDPKGPKPTFDEFSNALDPAEKVEIDKAIGDALAGIKPFNMVHKVIRPDGSVRHVHGQADVVRDESGAPVRMVGTGLDITERVRIEEELASNLRLIEAINQAQMKYISGKKMDEVFYQLLEAMRVVTRSGFGVIMELVPGENGNEARLDTLAITEVPANIKESGSGPTFTEFGHLICSPVKRAATVIENELTEDVSYCGVPGCCIEVKNYMGLPIRREDQIIGLIGFANRPEGYHPEMAQKLEPILSTLANIIIGARVRRARRKAQEEMAKAKEAAEQATKLKDQFVSLIAHDLRSPFTSILGFLRLLEVDAAGSLNSRQVSTIASAIASGEHMIQMIDELLDISRLKTGKIQPRKRFFNLRQIAAMAASNVSVLAEEKNVRVVNDTPEGTRIYADPALYSVVIQNLLSNAIKFSSEGSEVVIFTPKDNLASLAVKDSGSGVNEEFMEDLFRHEVKTTSPGSKGERGTGLGLPYSSDIMKAHGGWIWYETSHDHGSVFYTLLPFARPKVLVIDDNPGVRALARMYLEEIGAETVECVDGDEGLRAIHELQPHLVLTDIYMPGTGGLEVIKKVKADKALCHVPIIAVTSDASLEVREQALLAGADDFTTKPIIPNEFIPRVRRYIG